MSMVVRASNVTVVKQNGVKTTPIMNTEPPDDKMFKFPIIECNGKAT